MTSQIFISSLVIKFIIDVAASGSLASQEFGTFLRGFVRIRRLRKSPQYFVITSLGGNVSLRRSPQFSAELPHK